jgi:hypothetical protein
MKCLLSCLALALGGLLVFGQSSDRDRGKLKASEISAPVPIVFGRKNDGLPEKIEVRGTIEDLTFARAGCGVVAWGGTLRVRLDRKIPGYPYKDVFIVISCFPDFEKFDHRDQYIDKPVALALSKLYPQYQFGMFKDINKVPCAFDLITNQIDSEGVPFYCTQDNISASIEKLSIKNNDLPELHW